MLDETEEIKKRIDVVDLISQYLTVNKAGANYKAVCPFHNEKTPSLMISPEKQIWHCFGCSEGGDIFTFVMKMENLEFYEALKILAQRAGVNLTKQNRPENPKSGPQKSRLFMVNNLAAKVFQKILLAHPSGKPALEYLKNRKLSEETIKEFLLGYASSPRALKQILKKHAFSDQEIQLAGSPDKFFGRVIFPIRDPMANVIAFTGRVLDPNPSADGPKYLNTPETPIFHKSRVLYNFEKARVAVRTQNSVVVVEGQMDVISSWQANVCNVVATSGIALTPEHLKILHRISDNIIFAFDSDNAGLQSAKKAYEMAIVEGFNVKMVYLAEFKDPGEMISKDPKLWQEAVEHAQSIIDWYFNLAFEKEESHKRIEKKELTPQEKKEIAQEILPILKKIPDTIEQAHYVGLLAKRLGVGENVVFDALAKINSEKPLKNPPLQEAKKAISAEELLCAILVKIPDKIKEAKNIISVRDFQNPELKAIYNLLLSWYTKTNRKTPFLTQTRTSGQERLDYRLKTKIDELLLIIEEIPPEDLENDWRAVLVKFQKNQKEFLKNRYAEEIRKAEAAGDYNRLKKIIKEFQDEISS